MVRGHPSPLTPHQPKVTDFGLAKRLDADGGPTRSGALLGTPSYMPPEQADGKHDEVGPAADVYALGAVLYECLTGRPPFLGSRSLEIVVQVLTRDPVPPSRLQPGVPRDLETICLKCLEKSPAKRYASALELAEDLRRFRAGEPVRARRVGAAERVAKWARRRPAAAALVAVSAAAVLSLTAVGLAWYDREVRTAARQELQELRRTQGLREAVRKGLSEGQQAFAAGDFVLADDRLRAARERAGDEDVLADLRAEVEDWLLKTQSNLDDARRYQEFVRRRNEALYLETLFTGLDPEERARRTREAARLALAAFGLKAEPGDALDLARRQLDERQKDEVRAGCYEMLLVLAEAEATGEDRPEAARRALEVLDLARPPTPAFHLRRARYLEMLGRDKDAGAERVRAVRLRPVGALDHFTLGLERLRRGEWDDAAGSFDEALRLQPEHFWAQYLLANCQAQLRRWGEAKAGLNACLARRPELPWLHLLRGYVLAHTGEFAAAEEDLTRAAGLELNESSRYVLNVNRGLLRMRQKRFTEAAAEFERAVQVQPRYYQAHLNLAQARAAQERTDEAVRHLDEAIRLRPSLASLYAERAALREKLGRLNEALDDLNRAVEVTPPPGEAKDHADRGRLLYRLRRHADAVRAFDDALRVRGDSADAHRGRGDALLAQAEAGGDAARLRYEEAVRSYGQYLRTGRPAADVFRKQGFALTELGRHAEAADAYTHALALAADAGTRAARGGLYLLHLDAPKLARLDFEEALKLDADHVGARAGRGLACARLGDHAGAFDDADRLARRPPDAQRICDAARICAQAAATEPRPERARASQDRSLRLLEEALDAVAADRRAAFWREHIADDALFGPVRGLPRFQELDRLYGKPSR